MVLPLGRVSCDKVMATVAEAPNDDHQHKNKIYQNIFCNSVEFYESLSMNFYRGELIFSVLDFAHSLSACSFVQRGYATFS